MFVDPGIEAVSDQAPWPGLSQALASRLYEVYERLLSYYGPQGWWPGEEPFAPPCGVRAGPFEVMVGAILTQNTAWANVEKAIGNLKRVGALTPAAIRALPVAELARLIYPSGYYNGKAQRLKALTQWLGEGYQDDLARLFSLSVDELRKELLSIHGIGPETADAILLYAGRKPIFVIDAYTRRLLGRLGLRPKGSASGGYEAFQGLFMGNLPYEESLFNEFHALIVHHGKATCRKVPFCERCPLFSLCLQTFIKVVK